jgi:hypothetical protein
MTTAPSRPLPRTADAAPRLRRAGYEPAPGRPAALPRSSAAARAARPLVTTAHPVDAHRRIAPLLRVALEVLDGRRPPGHLDPHVSPAARRYWRAARGQRRDRTPARLLRLRVCVPAPGAAEVAAVCAVDGRTRALAARFEQRRSGWCCTVVRLL